MVSNECGRVQRIVVTTTSDHIRAKPDVCGSSVWDLFYIIFPEPRILRWLVLFGKSVHPWSANHFIQLPLRVLVKTAKGLRNIRRPGRALQLGRQRCEWRLSATEPYRSVWGRWDLLVIGTYGQPGWSFSWHFSVPSGTFQGAVLFQPLLIPFSSLPVHYSLIILPVDATHTGCFTTLGHNCRRWFPRSLWWKKFIQTCVRVWTVTELWPFF